MAVTQSIQEALSQGLCKLVEMAGWETVDNPLGISSALKTSPMFGKPLVLECDRRTVGLQFLRHSWSGTVKISTDAGEWIVSLSNDDDTDVKLVPVPTHDRPFRVTIEPLSIGGRDDASSEVWLLDIVFDVMPRPVQRSQLVNSGTRVVYGDWGEFLVLTDDQVIPRAIVRDGSWAQQDIRLFRRHARAGDLVLDIGANFGHHSVVLSKLVGSTGLVIAIEAQRLMYQLLHANAALNRRANIIPLHAAAGDAHGTVTLFAANPEGEDNYGRLGVDTRARPQEGGEEVAVHPLDDLLAEHIAGRRVTFAKIDVQAYELFVLKGMAKILERHRPTIFIEISPYWMRQAGYHYTEIYHLLGEYGYDITHPDRDDLAPNEIPDVSPETDIEWNLLAIHPEVSSLTREPYGES